jgi:hypothetical protein
MLKLGLVLALLAFPLPRLISNVALEPIFSIGLSLNRVVAGDEKFNECLIATTIADTNPDVDGAFSPKLRHNLACELANVHQMTAVGMTAGWTMLNMAFSPDYMHKAAFVPIFPNIPVFFAGLLILLLFFAALLPVPLYFLEVFIKLSLNLIMLPMFLLGWLFKGFEKIIPGNGAKSIQDTINELVQGVLGIAMIGIFISFSVMFLNAMFGKWQGANALAAAFANNDSRILMDGLTMNNDSIITIILMGLFIAMFMSMIPALVKAIFSINISDEYYKKAEKDVKAVWGNMKKWYGSVAKAVKK